MARKVAIGTGLLLLILVVLFSPAIGGVWTVPFVTAVIIALIRWWLRSEQSLPVLVEKPQYLAEHIGRGEGRVRYREWQ